MKNNKTMTSLLIALVIGIWGYVIYSIFSKTHDAGNQLVSQTTTTNFIDNLKYYNWRDTLLYQPFHRSPFEIEVYPSYSTEKVTLITKPNSNITPIPYINEIDVQYLGYIENQERKQRIALVQINGTQHYLEKKQTIAGVSILEFGMNSLLIKTNSKTRTIIIK